jgi:uncharacterized membrane protein YeiH
MLVVVVVVKMQLAHNKREARVVLEAVALGVLEIMGLLVFSRLLEPPILAVVAVVLAEMLVLVQEQTVVQE